MGELRERIRNPRLSFLVPGDIETRTGGYIYDRRILQGLRQAGWQVDVHSLDTSFPSPTPAALQQAQDVLAGIPDDRIVVIDGLAVGGMPAALRRESERLALVALIHHPLSLETGLAATVARNLRESERDALASVRRVIVTSRWTSRALDAYNVSADRIRVVEPGVDLPVRSPNSTKLRASHEPLRMLCVAHLTPRKGHAVLFDALARLRDRTWHLRCIGSSDRHPETARELRLMSERLALQDRIEFLGEVDDATIEDSYANADVFVLASHMEGYGMVLSEALAHGLPIVSTLAGAIPETVPKGASLLVRPGDDHALAVALASLMDEPERHCSMATNARDTRHALPAWSEAALKFAAALEDLHRDGR